MRSLASSLSLKVRFVCTVGQCSKWVLGYVFWGDHWVCVPWIYVVEVTGYTCTYGEPLDMCSWRTTCSREPLGMCFYWACVSWGTTGYVFLLGMCFLGDHWVSGLGNYWVCVS